MASSVGRHGGIGGGFAGVILLVTSCAGFGGADYLGGVVVDPAGVSVDVTQELIRDGGLEEGVLRAMVDERTVTLSTAAEFCPDRPDVVLDVDGGTLKVRLVMPPEGEPCAAGESYVVTVELVREFNEYQMSN